MSTAPGHDAESLRTFDALADRCRWVADAHGAGDLPQAIAALCDLYRHLADVGWPLPHRQAVLLQVHDASLDAELDDLASWSPATE